MTEMMCPIASASKQSEQIAVVHGKKSWSYKQLDQILNHFCQQSGKLPFVDQSPLAFFSEPCLESIVCLFSSFRLQLPVFPLNPRLPKKIAHSVLKEVKVSWPVNKIHINNPCIDPLKPFEQWDLGTCATFLLTSGSTSTPKIACHTLANHFYSALGSNQVIPLSSKDRWLLSLPLYHVGGIQILFRVFLAASTVVISESSLIQTILNQGITHLSLVPTHLFRLLREDPLLLKQAARQIKCILLGGAPISLSLYQQAVSIGFKIFTTYGCTEMTSQICTHLNASSALNFGYPLPFREVCIKNQTREIYVKGKTLFQGYQTKSGSLELPLDKEGWFATGDLGYLDQEGKLQIIGRKDRLFISGGENIQPEEIEKCLLGIPGIVQAIVVPAKDEEFGNRPIAFIKYEKNELPVQTMREFLQEQLPAFKIPIRFNRFNADSELKINSTTLAKLVADDSKAFLENLAN